MATEKKPLWLIRKGQGLFPEFQGDADTLAAIPQGARVRVELKQGRSPDRLRLYWRMLAYVRDATDCAPTTEALHSVIKLELGFGTPVLLPSGFKVMVPQSISYESMDEATFNAFFDGAVKWLAEKFRLDPLEFYDDRRAA